MQRKTFILSGLVLILIVILAGLTVPGRASGPFTVTSSLDEVDAAPGNGSCLSTPSGVCTLRAAIIEANALPGADTIILPAGAYTLTLTPIGGDNDGLNGDLDISDTLTISGAGSSATIIDGNTTDRVMHVLSPTVASVTGVTIRYGTDVNLAGGIFNSGVLTLTDVIIDTNFAPLAGGIFNDDAARLFIANSIIRFNNASTDGGGLVDAGGALIIENSLIMSNTAQSTGGLEISGSLTLTHSDVLSNTGHTSDGAGINNVGTSWIINSTIAGNRLIGSADGGGIANSTSGARLTINGSTISRNSVSSGAGGGIRNSGVLTLTNSTLSQNLAFNDGGGLFIGSTGVVSLNNVTIVSNTTNSGNGGGFRVSGVVTLRNTIVAHNIDSGGQAPDCSGTLVSQGYNIVGNADMCFFTPATGDQLGSTGSEVDPKIGPLADNGGSTYTHALLKGSPAINAGNPAGCVGADGGVLIRDQRGQSRIGNCDIGAFEYVQFIYLPLALKNF